VRNYAPSMRRILGLFLLGWVLAWPAPAQAASGLCTGAGGQPIPNCSVVGPDDPFASDDDGFGAIFGLFVVVGLVLGIGGAAYRMSTARNIAAKSGMDPDDAARMALLDDNGLTATYVLANLPSKESVAPAADQDRTVEHRLAKLADLLERRLITQAEYDEQRAAILGSV